MTFAPFLKELPMQEPNSKRPEGKGGGLTSPDLFVDLFHHCALWAYVWVATETGRNPPDSELTRRKAYDLYEEELRKKHCIHHTRIAEADAQGNKV